MAELDDQTMTAENRSETTGTSAENLNAAETAGTTAGTVAVETAAETPDGTGIPAALRGKLREREEVCAALAELVGCDAQDVPERLAQLRGSWAELAELPPEYAEIVEKKFNAALQRAEESWSQVEQRRARRCEALAAMNDLLAEQGRIEGVATLLPLRRQIDRLDADWKLVSAGIPDVEIQQNAFAAKLAELRARLDREEEAARDAFGQLQSMVAELEKLAASEDFDLLKKRKSELDSTHAKLLPKLNLEDKRTRDAEAKFHEFAKKCSARLGQHFQELDLARWESYTIKQDLLKELEVLAAAPDAELGGVARKFNTLRKKWWSLGAVPHEKQPEIAPRFKELSAALQPRLDAYYEALHAAQHASAARKTELCGKAESLMTQTSWNATADAMKALQQEWKSLPHAGRELDDALYARFRAACNCFFEARGKYFERRNQENSAAAEAKTAICVEAEALVEGPEGARQARDLRDRFRAAGSAGRQEPELARRFNAALDKFFNSRREELNGNAAKFRALLEELNTLDLTDDGAAGKRASQIRAELGAIGKLPRETAVELEKAESKAWRAWEERFRNARSSHAGTKFDRYKTAALELAEIWGMRGGDDAAGATARLEAFAATGFAALDRFAGLLRDGDDAKIEREFAAARKNHERLLEELGTPSEPESPLDLAAELTAAIAGNFGKSSGARSTGTTRTADRADQLDSYLGAGMLPAAELAESLRRFEEAWNSGK